MKTLLTIALLLITSTSHALERDYQMKWCNTNQGQPHRLPNGTQVDCLTATHAIEVEYASKFYEGIGQSLYYAMHTGKRAGILLIVKLPRDQRYLNRLNNTIKHHRLPIDVFTIERANT